ncbi:MAG: SDR family NAD(P)-dependent oxidoreductase [Syntrophobacteraceae bacterium]|jgi:NAD(P)-dependent dehydrogenase (short-subunit alcohol dehydrogenase family)
MKTIVITGGTSGLGAVAAQQLLRTPTTRVLIGARRQGPAKTETLSLELARLASVREFAEAVSATLGATEIDALVLNAGLQFPNTDQRTEDGFETTFAVNHLAHYLLLRLLLPKLAQGAIVVVTTSDTHDPQINPIAPPRHADARQLAHPRRQPGERPRPLIEGFRAYSTSKLCNLLTARALAASPDASARGLRVIAYNPGFTPGTGLIRTQIWPVRFLMGPLMSILRPIFRFNTIAQAGGVLAELTLGRIEPPAGRIFASLINRRLAWPDPSELARRDDVMKALWRDSAALVGISE